MAGEEVVVQGAAAFACVCLTFLVCVDFASMCFLSFHVCIFKQGVIRGGPDQPRPYPFLVSMLQHRQISTTCQTKCKWSSGKQWQHGQ